MRPRRGQTWRSGWACLVDGQVQAVPVVRQQPEVCREAPLQKSELLLVAAGSGSRQNGLFLVLLLRLTDVDVEVLAALVELLQLEVAEVIARSLVELHQLRIRMPFLGQQGATGDLLTGAEQRPAALDQLPRGRQNARVQ